MEKLYCCLIGLLIATTSFGQWTNKNISNAPPMKAVWSPSANTVYACARYDNIYKSTDSGVSWTPSFESSAFNAFYDIQFSSESNGVAVGNVASLELLLLHTSNGGQSWTKKTIASPMAFSTFYTIDFATQNVGFVGGSDGNLYKTNDGGANWAKNTSFPSAEDIIDIDAPSQNVVYATNFLGELYKSTDAAGTWAKINVPNVYPNHIQFLSENKGFVLAYDLTFLTTDNGGQTWTKLSQLAPNTNDFWMTDALNGYAITTDGKVLRTNDAAKSWIAQGDNVATKALNDIHFFNAQKGYIAVESDNPSILHTTNQGGIAAQIDIQNLRNVADNTFCQGDTIRLIAPSIGASSFLWKINGTTVSTKQNDEFILSKSYINTIELQASGNGQTLQLKKEIEAKEAEFGAVEITSGLYGPCNNDTVVLTIKKIKPFVNYFIRYNNTILADNLSGSDFIQYTLPMWSGTRKIEFWLKDQGCGNRKLGEHTIFFQPKPSDNLSISAVTNPICENDIAQIKLLKPDSNVLYQIFKDQKTFGFEIGSNQSSLTLTSDKLQTNTILNVKATRTPGCSVFLTKNIPIVVKEIHLQYTSSSANIGIGEPVTIINNSADSLQFKWNFGSNATPNLSNIKQPAPFFFSSTSGNSIQLEATSPSGCKKTSNNAITVYDTSGLKKNWIRVQNTRFEPYGTLDKLAVDSSNNIYATGTAGENYKLFSTAGNSFSGKGIGARIISKHNVNGVYQWQLKFNPLFTIHSLSISKKQNLYVLLSFKGDTSEFELPSRDNNIRKIKDNRAAIVAIYSPLGTLKSVYQIKETCSGLRDIEGLSLDVSSTEIITLTGKISSSCNKTELEIILDNGVSKKKSIGDSWRYFLISILPKHDSIVVRPYENLLFSSGFGYSVLPQKVVSDKENNLFLLGSGEDYEKDITRGIQLQKIDDKGIEQWKFSTATGSNNDNRYLLANDIALTAQGDIVMVGSIYGFGAYSPFSLQSVPAFTISLIDGKTGNLKWHRYFWTVHLSVFLTPTQPALGVAIDGDKIFAKARFDGLTAFIQTVPYCLSIENDPNNEFIFKMDTIGNLLQVTSSRTALFPQNPTQPTSSIVVRGKDIFNIGHADTKGIFDNMPFNVASSGNYIARTKDDQKYLPYITTPYNGSIGPNCEITFCNDKIEKLSVSPNFKNIKWKKDNIILVGETKPEIYPKANGMYSVEATNPNGDFVVSPTAVSVIIYPAPDTKITQKKDTLVAVFYPDAYYIWQDTAQNALLSGVEANKFVPPLNQAVQVIISGTNCNGTSAFYLWKPVAIHDISEKVNYINIYPNPSEGILNFQFDDYLDGELTILNLIGQVLYQESFEKTKQRKLDLSYLATGTYISLIKNNGLLYRNKFVLQHHD
jgi:photosystem II stability/assembly factor-like uncharacterized protein